MIQTCATCFYFMKNPMQLGQGFCRFMPPTAFLINSNAASVNPPVMLDNWCGQYMDDPSKTEKVTHEL